jgi:predicted Rossmann fold flavoprotein
MGAMDINTLIIGAGAAGLMCAAQTGAGTLVIDHAKAPAEKVRISGGGRCNFTNTGCTFDNFLGQNAHFHKSALTRYTQWDFIELVSKYGIAWHEKTLGQLFCENSAKDIIAMLLKEAGSAEVRLQTSLISLDKTDSGFHAVIETQGRRQTLMPTSIVIATGGKSIPKMGATGRGYQIAQQFGMDITDIRPALVPLTFSDAPFAPLSGTATPTRVRSDLRSFDEATLFTHRGLSGPAILQISSYWHEGAPIWLDLDPAASLLDTLRAHRQTDGRKAVTTVLSQHLPTRLVQFLEPGLGITGNLADQSDLRLSEIVATLRNWELMPTGSEGYRTAEVTLGGVDTDGLSSKTMMSKTVNGLYFIGEVVDVTGWLGGYNFQWAWSSGWAAGQAIAKG